MVLVIMVAVAAMLVPLVDNLEINDKTPEQIATEVPMQAIRDAIIGRPGQPGVWVDLGQKPAWFPPRVKVLLCESFQRAQEEFLNALPNGNYAGIGEYNPVTRIGWRGPYLDPTLARQIDGFPTLLDGWGNPFEIQIDFNDNQEIDGDPLDLNNDGQIDSSEERINEATFARLVSSGEDGAINTPYSSAKMLPSGFAASLGLTGGLTHADCGDDIVLFFQIPDTRE